MNDITIKFASKTDINQLKNIFSICFKDDDNFINDFFLTLFLPTNTVVAAIGEKIVGASYLIKADFNKKQGFYGYAVAVLPEYRNRGFCRQMQQYILNYCKSKGKQYILAPAETSLFSYYKSIGITEVFYIKKVTFDNLESLEQANFAEVRGDEYFRMRKKNFSNCAFVSLNKKATIFAINDIKRNGFALKSSINGELCAALGKIDDSKLLITELIASQPNIKPFLNVLAANFNKTKAEVLFPKNNPYNGKILPFALGYNVFSHENAYFNIKID
ncbi:MAG: GNAT family N-acetyltransferase [Clostridia bacterium]